MKQTIIQCVTALLCVVAIAVTSVISVNKLSTAKVEAAKATAANTSSSSSDTSGDTSADTDVPTDTDEPIDGTEGPAADDDTAVSDDDTASADDTSSSDTTASTSSSSTSTASTTKASSTSSVPSTKADIAAYYNTAVNKAVSSKAGFSKKRVTSISNLEGGALMKMSIVVDTVNDFLGVGTTNVTNTKGKAGEISNASLTANDISAATCKQSGDNYVITITLNSGTSKASSSSTSDTTALARTGLYSGTGDKKAYDYKSASNIYTGINNVDNASTDSVVENNKNIKITATVNSKTGNISALSISYDWDVVLTNVKYLVAKISSATGDAKTTVDFTNFSF